MYFPDDFVWGTATAAFQVEGNNVNSDWWAWEQEDGRILHNHKSGAACNWWEAAEVDLALAAEMGTKGHRLSLEWSRIEPEPSVFDEMALHQYRQILQGMWERDIEPMVTLHHFSNPIWLREKGDFNNGVVVEYFERYVEKVVTVLGDLVTKWVTINEPMVYVFLRYLDKAFPAPSRAGLAGGWQAIRNLLRCHAVAYNKIKEIQPRSLVGVAKNTAVFQPKTNNPVDKWWSKQISWLFNGMWMASMVDGRLRLPVGRERIEHLAGSFDFVGINYYSRYYLKPLWRGLGIERDWGAGAMVSDGDYGEVYPTGLFEVLKWANQFQKPIYITENGVPDKADKLRPSFLITHLREVWRAISFCYPVMGYYHWSLVDNFEWDRGWTQRFGLIEMNPETQERRWRESGRLYSQICHQNAINEQMAATYAPELLETLFPG